MNEDNKMPVAHDQGENPQHPGRQQLKFRGLPGTYNIVRLDPEATVPDWATKGIFSSVTRTADELSIVCPADNLPAHLRNCHEISNSSFSRDRCPRKDCVIPISVV